METSRQTREKVRSAKTGEKADAESAIFRSSWIPLAEEMSSYFRKNCYWLFWEYPEWRIRKNFESIKETGRTNFEHYMKMLKTVEEAEREHAEAGRMAEKLFWVRKLK